MAAPRGKPHQGNPPKYDPGSGKEYKPGARFRCDTAVKLVRAAHAANLSVSELLNELVLRMEVDEAGRPLWIADRQGQEGRLPLEAPSDVTAA